jgi:hypothetical protein
MTYAYEIQMNAGPEKQVTFCSDSQAALRALQAAKTMSALVQQCPKCVQYFHPVFCRTVLGHRAFWGSVNQIAVGLPKDGNCSPVCCTRNCFGGL